ncbi:MAG: DUF2845 domain-containing protein [Thiohalomonadales bacterium]
MRICQWLIAGLLVTSAGITVADTMRCGTRLVRDGDSMAYVFLRCGEPMFKSTSGSIMQHNAKRHYVSEVSVETWTYHRGSRKFLQILRFEGDLLASIRTGERAP